MPDNTQFATVEELKAFDTDDTDADGANPAKVYFGNNNQQWWIAGSQNGNLTLFAASPLATGQVFESNYHSDKTYNMGWNCDYTSTGGSAPIDVYPNHYGASPLRATLRNLESSNFTDAEQTLMNTTTIYTNDTKNSSVYSTNEKLYLAYGDCDDEQYITVGTNASNTLNGGLRIDKGYWGNDGDVWLRAPYMYARHDALVAIPGTSVNYLNVITDRALVPAFELNLSSVIFASAAPAAVSDGRLTLADTDGGGGFTMRYSAGNLGSAQIAYDYRTVNLSGVPSGAYLVAQNENGACAKAVSGTTSVSASGMGIDSFENCRVWLEKTDSSERKTYATMATCAVNVTPGDGMRVRSGSLTQKVDVGNLMADIVIEADSAYMFPADYSVAAQNGITVTRDSDSQITVSGTPTADVNLTLPAATQKAYGMESSGNGTFGSVCVGYAPDKVAAQDFTITNTGNVELTNVQVTIGGTDSSDFALSWDDKVTTIRPNGTIKVTVKPEDSLAVKEYQAKLFVSADNCNTASKTLQFTVAEHDYEWTYNNDAACEKNGTETGVCKDCGDKTTREKAGTALEHQPGGWIIDKEATATTDGEKHKECTVCRKVLETETILATGTPGGRYKILEGADQTWKGSGSLTIKANGNISKFTGIKVDGVAVDSSNYEAKSGSTVVTLKESYLAGLSAGVHTLTFVYNDEEVSTRFMIADKETSGTPETPDNSTKDNQNTGNRTDTGSRRSPQTGDKTNISLYLLLLLMSGLMIAFCVEWKKIKSKC